MDESEIEFVRALYPYTGADQAVPLPFAESTVLQVVERNQNGWCRGFSAGREGWFPISYVKPLANRELIQVCSIVAALITFNSWWKIPLLWEAVYNSGSVQKQFD